MLQAMLNDKGIRDNSETLQDYNKEKNHRLERKNPYGEFSQKQSDEADEES